jgi:lauroyl/myristoyl acyltransferase
MSNNSRATWVRRKWVKPFFERRERRFTAGTIQLPHDDSLRFTRRLVDCLTRKEILCAAGDGAIGHKKIVLCFLGQPTAFATGLVSLARLTGAPILPMFCLRSEDGKAILQIEAPLYASKDTDTIVPTRELLAKYAALLEARVRQAPEQYRNWHMLGAPLLAPQPSLPSRSTPAQSEHP